MDGFNAVQKQYLTTCFIIHDHKIILDPFEARENLNHDEYAEDKNYYNGDSDDSDDDDN